MLLQTRLALPRSYHWGRELYEEEAHLLKTTATGCFEGASADVFRFRCSALECTRRQPSVAISHEAQITKSRWGKPEVKSQLDPVCRGALPRYDMVNRR